jgi:hypothetical protein
MNHSPGITPTIKQIDRIAEIAKTFPAGELDRIVLRDSHVADGIIRVIWHRTDRTFTGIDMDGHGNVITWA